MFTYSAVLGNMLIGIATARMAMAYDNWKPQRPTSMILRHNESAAIFTTMAVAKLYHSIQENMIKQQRNEQR